MSLIELQRGSVAVRLGSGTDFSDDALAGMESLRRRMKLAKPGFAEEAESRRFQYGLESCGHVAAAFDGSGEVVAFAAVRLGNILTQQCRLEWMYGYAHPSSPAGLGASLYAATRWAAANERGAEVVRTAASVSLPGFIALSRSGAAWLLGDSGAPPWAVRMMEEVGRSYGSRWDPVGGLIEGPAWRVDDASRTPADPDRARVARRYRAVNPHWRDGFQALAVSEQTYASLHDDVCDLLPELLVHIPAHPDC